MYHVDVDPTLEAQISALPASLLNALAEAIAMLELTPWNCPPINEDNPSGAVRTILLGDDCILTFLILEDQHRVDLLEVVWLG